jgi:hypothetical protein
MYEFRTIVALGALTLSLGCGNEDNGRSTAAQNAGTSAAVGGESTGGTGSKTTGTTSSTGGASALQGAGGNANNANNTGGAAAAGGSGTTAGGHATSATGDIVTGGNVGSGGSASSTGGNVSLGGSATSTVGTVSSGGSAIGTGGNVASGGSVGIGGSAASTGGNVASGGSVASTGGASVNIGGTVGVGGSTSDCNYPACLTNLLSVCPMSIDPLPSCVYQDTITGNIEQSNACYSDGQSASTTIDLTTYNMTMVFKRNGAVCYSIESTSSHAIYKNASGNIVATEDLDASVSPKVDTVTCAGEQPVVLNSSCSDGQWWDLNCQKGVCNP